MCNFSIFLFYYSKLVFQGSYNYNCYWVFFFFIKKENIQFLKVVQWIKCLWTRRMNCMCNNRPTWHNLGKKNFHLLTNWLKIDDKYMRTRVKYLSFFQSILIQTHAHTQLSEWNHFNFTDKKLLLSLHFQWWYLFN